MWVKKTGGEVIFLEIVYIYLLYVSKSNHKLFLLEKHFLYLHRGIDSVKYFSACQRPKKKRESENISVYESLSKNDWALNAKLFK